MAQQEMLKWYDGAMLKRTQALYYNNSDYYNFGYWGPETRNQAQASEALVEKLLSFLPEKRGNILDVACGLGASTKQLLRYYKPEDVVAINISEVQLARTRRNAPGVDARLMDAVALDFPDASFDSVICVEAAFHFDTRERYLREAARVLKPGGRLVQADILFGRTAVKDTRMNFQPENYVEGPAAFRDLLLRAGFASAEVMDVTTECWEGFRDNLRNWPSRAHKAREIGPVFAMMARFVTPMMAKYWERRLEGYVLASAQKAA